MATKYLLPCDCGKAVPIETSQAGEQVGCACGATLDIPTLRGIKQLAVEEPTSDAKPKAEWNALSGSMFSVGLLLAVIGVTAASYYFYQASLLPTEDPNWYGTVEAEKTLDTVDSFHLVDIWNDFVSTGLGERHEPQHIVNRATVAHYRLLGSCGAGAGVLGLLLIVGSFFMTGKSSAS